MRNENDIRSFTATAEYNMLGHRQAGFKLAMEHLLSQSKQFIIIETGSLRSKDTPEAWLGDGRSTAVWGMFLEKFDSLSRRCHVYSIDIDKAALDNAAMVHERIDPILGDSLKVLPQIIRSISPCKLLYLDSFDWSSAKNQESAWHHMCELTLVYSMLPAGCMIMVDDAHDELDGKHWIIAEFFKTIGVEPVLEGYQWAWIKPENSSL